MLSTSRSYAGDVDSWISQDARFVHHTPMFKAACCHIDIDVLPPGLSVKHWKKSYWQMQLYPTLRARKYYPTPTPTDTPVDAYCCSFCQAARLRKISSRKVCKSISISSG